MLVLSRKVGQEIVISDDVRVRILSIDGKRVRIGVAAPSSVTVHRAEIQRYVVEFETEFGDMTLASDYVAGSDQSRHVHLETLASETGRPLDSASENPEFIAT